MTKKLCIFAFCWVVVAGQHRASDDHSALARQLANKDLEISSQVLQQIEARPTLLDDTRIQNAIIDRLEFDNNSKHDESDEEWAGITRSFWTLAKTFI